MRIRQIEVSKLFGVFDHTIPINHEDRITIVHGPNGYGKTAILLLVRALLQNQFARLRRIPFERFTLKIDDGSTLSVSHRAPEKQNPEKDGIRTSLFYQFVDSKGKSDTYTPESPQRETGFPVEIIERHIEDLQRAGPELWLQVSTGRILDVDDVLEQYADFLPTRVRQRKPLPEWLGRLPREFEVRLIEAQRLLSLAEQPRHHRTTSGNILEPAVSSYSKELAAAVQEIRARYGTSSQQLDSTFPNRVIQATAIAPVSVETLKDRLRELEQKRQRIIAAGLLTDEAHSTPIFDPHKPIDATTQSILTLYSEDVEKKLSVFAAITEKIELFKELVNKRFSYKNIDIEPKTGFRLRTAKGGPLLPSDLSSGEQHELVLLYELLFKTKPNALILIDEPELSLHVAWQVEFLKDLARVIKVSSFDVILATHSPQIINDRWDLTVELKGP